jgi:lectin-like protein
MRPSCSGRLAESRSVLSGVSASRPDCLEALRSLFRDSLGGHVAALVLALSPLACLRSTTFTCATSTDCGTDGVCEPNNFCSFADASCAQGRRYGSLSGPVAGQCVGETPPPTDGGADTPPPSDMMIDAPVTCKNSSLYNAITGGNTNHTYRLVATSAQWMQQRDQCAVEGGNLAIPDDTAELMGVSALAGTGIWIGLSDLAVEGTFVNVLGQAPTFNSAPLVNGMAPWANGQPDNKPNPGADCARADTNQTFSDDKCNGALRAVCECVVQ